MAEDAAPKSLKHLTAVQTYGTYVSGVVTKGVERVAPLYEKGKSSYVPNFAKPWLADAEEKIMQYATPALTTTKGAVDKLLYNADEKVDRVYSVIDNGKKSVGSALDAARELQRHNVETYRATTQKYFVMVSSAADWVASKVSPSQALTNAQEMLASAMEQAKKATDPDAAVHMVYDAWMQFASTPAVAKVLPHLEPTVKKGLEGFCAMHDYVVANPMYKRGVSATSATAAWATTTTPYRMGSKLVYPLVQPIVDPALDKLSKSLVVNQVLDYWKPVSVA